VVQACVFQKERPISRNENKTNQKRKTNSKENKTENIYKRCMGDSSGKVLFESLAIHREGVWLSL
jgi:hypothetical protein